MSVERDFYSEMTAAIRREYGAEAISEEVWREFCSEITPAPAAPAPPPPPEGDAAPALAPALPADWEALHKTALGCNRCKLRAGCTQVVFGEGDVHAKLMFVGEGPGADEDIQGRPFVGAAGQLLDRMIAAMGFARSEVYIANVVKCRPPNNRNPEPEEAEACRPYLDRQIELVKPEAIVLLGAVALLNLMNMTGIRRCRGKWLSYRNIPVMPTFHPAYLLRTPEDKRLVWGDLKMVLALLGMPVPERKSGAK